MCPCGLWPCAHDGTARHAHFRWGMMRAYEGAYEGAFESWLRHVRAVPVRTVTVWVVPVRAVPVAFEPPSTPTNGHRASTRAPHCTGEPASVAALGTRSLRECDATEVERIDISTGLESRFHVRPQPKGLDKREEVLVTHVLALALQGHAGRGSSMRWHSQCDSGRPCRFAVRSGTYRRR